MSFIEVDFQNDFRSIIKNNLESMGFKLPKDERLESLLLHYLNTERRSIKPQKRNVKISKEICKHKHYLKEKENIDNLRKKIENGDDINVFLSTKIKNKPNSQDSLLNDWGIHHLHLEEGGTKELLFAFFNEKNAYFIDIMPHENPKEPQVITWANIRLVQILHDNWPELLAPYKINEISDYKITNEDRRNNRKNNINTLTTVSDGTIYFLGGITRSGHGLKNMTQLNKTISDIKEMQEYILKKLEKENISSLQLQGFGGTESSYCASIKITSSNKNETWLIEVGMNIEVDSNNKIPYKCFKIWDERNNHMVLDI